jgi:rhamnose utilization protein RhaD (predicted bifunctional aldolase and dehydrogenase)/NAD(P)-dependent dehydrogenase (short-subunit alcohol dehydrogenase family)
MQEIDNRVKTAIELGSDPDLVLHGGGNASLKVLETDHAGRIIKVLRVKGSGSNMGTITREGFTGLRMEDLLHARTIDHMSDDQMMTYLKKSMIDPSEPSPSVESFLHAFLPYSYVDHSHSDHILMLTNSVLKDKEIENILGNVIVIPYIAPGFQLARKILEVIDKITPDVEGIVLLKHGLFTFGETAEISYERHMAIVNRAKTYIKTHASKKIYTSMYSKSDWFDSKIPTLRGLLSNNFKKVLYLDRSKETIEIACSVEGKEFRKSGPATPDMLIRTKYDYLYLEPSSDIEGELEKYKNEYIAEYKEYITDYQMHDPYPTVIVVQGYGIITAGRTYNESKIINDQIVHSFRVNSTAKLLGGQQFISRKNAFSMEYWPLEEAKLKKFKPRPLDGTISIVTGAASGIGLEAFKKLAENGSTVIGVDYDPSTVAIGKEISKTYNTETMGYIINLTDSAKIKTMVDQIVSTYGGVDIVFHNAGILKSEFIEEISLETMKKHLEINSIAPFVLSQSVFTVMRLQGIGGNFVFNITKNLTNPGPGMVSYGTTKAFSAQLSHYIAKEGGKYGIRSNIINPDKIFKNSKIWENGVLEARAKAKGITVEEYKRGNLLHKEVLPEHVANMLLAMVNEDIFGATTDSMIPVDGGIL